MNPLKDREILLGVTGGIAAYKIPYLIRQLKEKGACVRVILTENAKRFLSPLVVSTLSDGTYTTLWEADIPHIKLTENASLLCIAPADYNIIGKAASGIADDLLSTVIAASDTVNIYFPSMNNRMYDNPILKRNIGILKEKGDIVIEAEKGELACGDEGRGRLPSIDRITIEIERALSNKILKDKKCIITGGGTVENIDPVRGITNSSSGKMAYSLARACYLAGGEVELILGKTAVEIGAEFPYKVNRVENTEDMYDSIKSKWEDTDILFMAAAVSDFKVEKSKKKIKRGGDISITLKENIDILSKLMESRGKQYVVGFSVETDDLLENSIKKYREKGVDLMIANDYRVIGDDRTEGYIIFPGGKESFNCSKDELAWKILKKINL